MTEMEKAYLAGLFDGEGCIHIRFNRSNGRGGHVSDLYSLITKLSMCDERVVKYAWKKFGVGHVGKYSPRNERWNPGWSWVCSSQDAKNVLLILRPYLRTKAKEADIALNFMKLPLARGGRNRTDPKLVLRRRRFYLRLREAKRGIGTS